MHNAHCYVCHCCRCVSAVAAVVAALVALPTAIAMLAALLVNQYYILGASLRFRPYFEWVPSEANIADLPSRGKVTAMLAIIPHARRVPLVYPRMFHGECDLVQFARSVGLT